MKDYHLFLILLAAPLLVILGLSLAEPVPESSALVHPEFTTMLHSANSQASSSTVKYLGFALGMCIHLIFGMCLYWGSKRAKDSGFRQRDLIVLMGFYLFSIAVLILSSWEYDHQIAPLWGGLPVPTAWMLYGIWFVPIIFIVLYVLGFKRHVLSEEDEAVFHEILKNRAERSSDV